MPTSEALGFVQAAFDTHAAFADHLVKAAHSAQREIWMADADFAAWPLNRGDFTAALHHFLRANPANRLYLLTLDAQRIEASASRLMAVLRTFSHAAQCRIVPGHGAARFGEACSLMLVDQALVVRRFHRDSARGIVELDPGGVRIWIDQFQSLWDESTPCLAATTLGLP